MAYTEVDIKTWKEKTNEWLARYSEYLNKLKEINVVEAQEIRAIKLENSDDEYDKHDVYLTDSKYSDRVKYYKDKRDALKEEYGEYVSYFNCPYYCVVHNNKELEEFYSDTPTDKKGYDSNYYHNKKGLKKFKGKIIQDEASPEFYGNFIGIAFFTDQGYWLIKDKKTGKEKFFIHADFYFGERKERSYNIVENGKDYI